MATGFGNWANTVQVHSVLKKIAQNEVERLRPASRLAEVTSINSDDKTLLVKFVGEVNEVLVPFTSVSPSNIGQWVRVGGTTHDRYVEDVIGTTDTESRLKDVENYVNQVMTSILGNEWSEDDDGEDNTFLTRITDFFGGLGGGAEEITELIKALADNPLGTLEDAKNKIADMLQNAFGLIDPSRIPLLPASHVGSAQPNLLVNYTFENAISIEEGSDWEWDGTTGHAAPGSAKALGTSSRKVLTSVEILCSEGQSFDVSGWVRWDGVTVTGGNAFQIAIVTYNGDSVVSENVIQSITSPTASSGSSWVNLTGTYVVPAGVTAVRLRLIMTSGVQTGAAWFDDMSIKKTGEIQQSLVSGLVSTLSNIWSSFTGIFEKITGIPGATISTLTQWMTQLKSILSGFSVPSGDLFPTLSQQLKAGLDSTIANVNSFVQNLLNAILQGIRKVPVVGGTIADVISDLTGMKDDQTNIASNINAAITGGAPAGTGQVSQVFDSVKAVNDAASLAQEIAITAQQQIQQNETNNNGGTVVGGNSWATTFSGSDGSALPSADWPTGSSEIVIRGDRGYAGIQSGAGDGVFYRVSAQQYVGDSQAVGLLLGDSANSDQRTGLLLRSNSNATVGAYCGVSTNGIVIGRYTRSGSTWSRTQFASQSMTLKTGDVVWFMAHLNNYYVYVNGKVVLTFTDTGNTVALGATYRYCGFSEQRSSVFISYDSFRVVAFAMADWVPPGASVTTPSWRLNRSSTSRVSTSTFGWGTYYAVQTSFFDTTDYSTDATVTNLGQGEVTIATTGFYEISCSIRGGYSNGNASVYSNNDYVAFWKNGTKVTGPVIAEQSIVLLLAAGDVIKPGIFNMYGTSYSNSNDMNQILGGPGAHFTGRLLTTG